jgi:diguanylate cyclase (GGDEF)-like protein
MTSSSPPLDAREASRPLDGGRYLDGLVAMLTAVVALFYWIAPVARHGMMMTFFIPVCVSGFYLGAKRSALIAGTCALAVCLSFTTGATPAWPTDHWTQALTLVLWTVSIGCCSLCVSGMSHVQLAAMAKMQRKHVSERLVDGLTGIKNRLAFEYEFREQRQRTRANGGTLALLMIDVDHFKKFNDRHGHKAGDSVLRQVAKILSESTREEDVVVRYGGEEFVVLMPKCDLRIAQNASERIRSSIELLRFKFEGTTMRLTVSVGIAIGRPDESRAEFVDRADAALYTSKHAGRNCVHYHDGNEFKAFGSTLAIYPVADGGPPELDAISDDAYTERVTGLPHRRVFHEELKRRVAEAHRYRCDLTLIFVKIEHYSQVVQMGADAEVTLLAILAEKLRAALRDCDLGCRTGRYEFAALLPHTTLNDGLVPAQRIQNDVTECRSTVFRGMQLDIRASIGVTQVVASDDAVLLIQRARAAAQRAACPGGPSIVAADGRAR